jgi:G3E family GTPase
MALRRDPRPDHLLIEASGISDPTALAEIAVLDPELSLGGVIVLLAEPAQNRGGGIGKSMG